MKVMWHGTVVYCGSTVFPGCVNLPTSLLMSHIPALNHFSQYGVVIILLLSLYGRKTVWHLSCLLTMNVNDVALFWCFSQIEACNWKLSIINVLTLHICSLCWWVSRCEHLGTIAFLLLLISETSVQLSQSVCTSLIVNTKGLQLCRNVVMSHVCLVAGMSWHAPSYQWTQRVRKELTVPNTERAMANIWRKIDQAQSSSSVLHSAEVACRVTLRLYFYMLCFAGRTCH